MINFLRDWQSPTLNNDWYAGTVRRQTPAGLPGTLALFLPLALQTARMNHAVVVTAKHADRSLRISKNTVQHFTSDTQRKYDTPLPIDGRSRLNYTLAVQS